MSLQNVAFRGTKLMNTEFVYGCALYTGADTKMSQNSKKNPTKFSSIEVIMNKYLIVFFILLLVEIIVSSVLQFTTGIDRSNLEDSDVPWYLSNSREILDIFEDALSFLVLYNYIIPISLYVTLELQKFCGSLFLVWDLQSVFEP